MDLSKFFQPDTLVAFGTILGATMGVLWKMNLLRFGKQKICEPSKCPDPLCKNQIEKNAENIKDIKSQLGDIHPKIDSIAEDVAYLRGLGNGKGRL